jgi:hypothetical protein
VLAVSCADISLIEWPERVNQALLRGRDGLSVNIELALPTADATSEARVGRSDDAMASQSSCDEWETILDAPRVVTVAPVPGWRCHTAPAVLQMTSSALHRHPSLVKLIE